MANGPGRLSFSPASVLLLTLLFVIWVQGTALYFLLQQPWTGLRLEPDRESGFVRVAAVADNSPASGKFQPGQLLVSLADEQETIPLVALATRQSSEIAERSVHDEFLDLQGRLSDMLRSATPLTYTTLDGAKISLTPWQHTPFRSIPATFWLLFLMGMVGLACGVLVWTYRSERLGARLLLAAAVSSYPLHTVFAVMVARELALPEAVMEWLSLAELVCVHVYVVLLVSILAFYPHRVVPLETLWIFAALSLFILAGYYFRWFEIPVHQFYFPITAPYLFALWLSRQQWQKSVLQPLDRAAVLVMQLSILLPTGLVIAIFILPLMFQQQPLISSAAMRLIEVSVFIGYAVAILRFRLFEVEYWWFKSWLWVLGGAAVILVDATLIGLFQTPQFYALGLSVLLVGFLYFPVRQWLLGKLMPLDAQSLQDFLPQFSAAIAKARSPAEFETGWQSVLQARFVPLHITAQTKDMQEPQLSENGLHLWVPGLTAGKAYQLSGKQRASRLFGKTDMQTAESLRGIACMAFNASESRKQAILAERERLLHEMHQTVGKRLQQLAKELHEPQLRRAADATLQTLDETVRLALPGTSLELQEHLRQWETETRQRIKAASVRLDWRVGKGLEDRELSPRQVLELGQFVREAISNALKHAQPERLAVHFRYDEGYLQVNVENDGDILPAQSWQSGTGLRSMAARINALDGDWCIRHGVERGCVCVGAAIPL
ncbi:MAG: hypothetical protein R3E95_24285 [Thiolinea sp.]